MLTVSALLLVDHTLVDEFGNAHACGVMDTFTVQAQVDAEASASADDPALVAALVRRAAGDHERGGEVFVYWQIPPDEQGEAWLGRLEVEHEDGWRKELVTERIATEHRNAKWFVKLGRLPLISSGEHRFHAYARPASATGADWGAPLATFYVLVRALVEHTSATR